MFLDLLVCELDGFEHICFRYLVHLALHHHDVVEGGTHHDVHVGLSQLLEGGVDDELTVDACNTRFGDGSVEGYVGNGQCCRCGQSGQCIGHVLTIGREENHVHKYLGVVIVREEGSQHTVDESAGQYLSVGRSSFSFQEASGEASRGGKFLAVINRQRHEVGTRGGIFGCANGGQQHRVAHTKGHGAVCLFCQLPRFERDRASV